MKPKGSLALGEGKAAKQWDFHKVHQKSEMAAPPSAPATTQKGRGAIAISATARTQAIEVSTTKEAMSHELGRDDQMRRLSRLL